MQQCDDCCSLLAVWLQCGPTCCHWFVISQFKQKNNMKLWNFINSYLENISLLQVSVWNNDKTCTSFWNTNEKQKLDLVLRGGLIVLLRPRGQIRRCIARVNYSFEVESKEKKVPGYHQSLNWNRSPTGRAISVRPTREASCLFCTCVIYVSVWGVGM